jgi:hypothetical protein
MAPVPSIEHVASVEQPPCASWQLRAFVQLQPVPVKPTRQVHMTAPDCIRQLASEWQPPLSVAQRFVTQRPPLHTAPEAHWEELEQVSQRPALQTRPASHWVEAEQGPHWPPARQASPARHSSCEAHAPQTPEALQACCWGQSLAARQRLHAPPSQNPVAQSLGATQVRPSPQGAHSVPPQSSAVSKPSSCPSAQLGFTQRPDSQRNEPAHTVVQLPQCAGSLEVDRQEAPHR